MFINGTCRRAIQVVLFTSTTCSNVFYYYASIEFEYKDLSGFLFQPGGNITSTKITETYKIRSEDADVFNAFMPSWRL